MGMSVDLQNTTRREWRELGFFFAYDGSARRWVVTGSAAGIRAFCKVLADYAKDPKHERESEHEHYGPYQDLKLVTSPVSQIRSDGIYGRLADFARLADAVEAALREGATSTTFGQRFVGGLVPENELVVVVASDNFDPATADAGLTN
jgi:hypothetical protein